MNERSESRPIAITCGDPAGVGPELIERVVRAGDVPAGSLCVIGADAWVHALAAQTGVEVEPLPAASMPQPGRPTVAGAELAFRALECAAQGCLAGRYRAVVSGPVSKHWMQQAGFTWPGQTEFFAAAWGGDPTMAFVGNELRVVLATWHIPLRSVADAITAGVVRNAVERACLLARLLGIDQPRIGVCGINPHAGEGGLLGVEERDRIDPVLDELRARVPHLSACLPGDTVFSRQRKGHFDVTIAMYHDQGLAAVKTLEFDRAVNVTLGLDYIRTSPDHGTAFDLTGTGQADPASFRAALRLADRLSRGGA